VTTLATSLPTITADPAQRPREVRGALRSSPDSGTHPRPHGRVEKIFAPYTETGTLATDELATISRTSTTTSPKRSS
jgi:hypothetical protein